MSNTAVGVPVELRGVRAAFDVERIRADFPILRRQVRGRALTYLDNAAPRKPQQVLDALTGYYTTCNANVHRGVHFSARSRPRPTTSRGESAGVPERRVDSRNRLHAQLHRGHQPGRARLRPRWRVNAEDEILIGDGAPLQHRPVAAALRGRGAQLRVARSTIRGR